MRENVILSVTGLILNEDLAKRLVAKFDTGTLKNNSVAEQQPPVHDMPQFSPGLYIQYRE